MPENQAGARASKRCDLTGILNVTGDAKILDIPGIIESPIIMPGYVSVRVESFANHCPEKVGRSAQLDIRARRVERRRHSCLAAAGAKSDRLSLAGRRRTDPIELQIPSERVCGARALIYKVFAFNAEIAIEVYLDVHLWVYRESCVAACDVACDMNGNVSIHRIAADHSWVDGQSITDRRNKIINWDSRGSGALHVQSCTT